MSVKVDNTHFISRVSLLEILRAALDVESYRFARQAATAWLAVFPGDLQVSLLLAQALSGEKRLEQALAIATRLCRYDPIFLAAQRLLCQLTQGADAETHVVAAGVVYALTGEMESQGSVPDWSLMVRAALSAQTAGQLDESEKLIHQALAEGPQVEMAAICHVLIAAERKENATVAKLAQLYHERWPECLAFRLWLAEAEMEAGNESGGLALLHHCVTYDTAAQVPAVIWGQEFRYRPLWPETLNVHFDLPIPAEVAGRLGWNQLSAGEVPSQPVLQEEGPTEQTTDAQVAEIGAQNEEAGEIQSTQPESTTAETQPTNQMLAESQAATKATRRGHGSPSQRRQKVSKETVHSAEEVLEGVAQRVHKPGMGKADGRFPMYVIFSSRKGLEQKYGEQTTNIICRELNQLMEIVRRRSGWGALVFFPDDPACTALLGLDPVGELDPWKFKLSLADLDQVLARKGERIGAVLIVGGSEVMPFHRLPNPTDDGDDEVLSDNPYSTLDSNYFVPEWPVGRLPDEAGKDAGLLLAEIRNLVRYHTEFAQGDSWFRRFLYSINLIRYAQKLVRPKIIPGSSKNFGYTASVWRRSSLSVFRQIGEPNNLLASPPLLSGSFRSERLSNANLGYFNLHGLEDSENWYGQRDLSEAANGPDYPVALTPSDVGKNNRTPRVVFCEACYGGFVNEKTEEQSLALKFIGSGALAFVGATCISYGSVSTPLIGADLLASIFWRYLREGYPAGDALLQAKIATAREMNKRQGYLDGEDQKTLISFVLYGDPLVSCNQFQVRSKAGPRSKQRLQMALMCDHDECEDGKGKVPGEVLREVKQMVEPYLPGMNDIVVHINREHSVPCGNDHMQSGSPMHKGSREQPKEGRVVVTISKTIKVAQLSHSHYVRVTLNAEGKAVKLALSR